MRCTNYNFYDNKVLSFPCALLLIYITTIFSAYSVSGRGVENLKTCEQGIFHRVRTCEKPCGMGVCLAAACMLPYPPPPHPPLQPKIQCWSLISAPARASEQHWSIHFLSEGRGQGRISVLWVRKYKTYFFQDSVATLCNFKNNHWGNFQLKGMIKWNNKHLQLSYETRQNKLHPDWWWSS